MPRTYIGEYENTLYIVFEDTRWSEPYIFRCYYPVHWDHTATKFFQHYGEHKRGMTVTWQPMMQRYQDEEQLCYLLPYAGYTTPAFTEEIPLPCPKVRTGIETRYRDGRWQKLLRDGWVPA